MIRNEFRIEQFSINLKAARKSKHLTQKALASSIGVNERTIINWEKGRPTKKGETPLPDDVYKLMNLSDALECDIDYLLGRIDTPRRETTDVCETTGLAVETVDSLMQYHNAPDNVLSMPLRALIDFVNEVFPKLSHTFGSDFLQLQGVRKIERDDGYFNTEEEVERYDEWESRYPSKRILTTYQFERFLITEIVKEIEKILSKESINYGA
jgi:transcriptional regulator with XRE-family HTH domain